MNSKYQWSRMIVCLYFSSKTNTKMYLLQFGRDKQNKKKVLKKISRYAVLEDQGRVAMSKAWQLSWICAIGRLTVVAHFTYLYTIIIHNHSTVLYFVVSWQGSNWQRSPHSLLQSSGKPRNCQRNLPMKGRWENFILFLFSEARWSSLSLI